MSSHSEQYVCPKCFSDEHIQQYIETNASSNVCSFCGSEASETIALPLDQVAKYIEGQLYKEFDWAANHLPFESREGGYLGRYWDTWELLNEVVGLGLPSDDNLELLQALVDEIGMTDWCEKHPFSLNDDQIIYYSWHHFCQIIKHDRRFFLSDYENQTEDKDILSPLRVLDLIFSYAEDIGLFEQFHVGSILFRARSQKPEESWMTGLELGPPPAEMAIQTNRMNPPGIPMMYASDDTETALRETANRAGTFVVGRFVTLCDLYILNLTKLPPIPSLFYETPDSWEYEPRFALKFLHHIVEEISKPIARDEKIHLEYIPTQIIGEYIRLNKTYEEKRVNGLLYLSSVHQGHNSIVLFASQKNVQHEQESRQEFKEFDSTDKWIKLIDYETVCVSQNDIDKWAEEKSSDIELALHEI